MNRIVLVAPAYNAERTMHKFLLSLAVQSHPDWHLILIDDMSTDNTRGEAWSFSRKLGIRNRVHVIQNFEKLWEVANVLKGLQGLVEHEGTFQHIQPDDIIARIDPDDYLSDADALRIISDVYDQTQCDVLWTKHRWFDEKRITSYNISAQLPDNADPYQHPWVTSHLKTFRRSLIDGVNDTNFRGADGKYIKRAGDQAIYLPILHQAKRRVFLPLVTYAYRCNLDPETFQTDDAKFQAAEAQFLRQRGFVK